MSEISQNPAGVRCAVLGRGMLGSEVIAALEAECTLVSSYDLPNWSITSHRDLEAALNGVDVVVNCAAYTNVDGAESDVDTAFAVNSEAVEDLAKLCTARDCYLVHVSTDFVFDGQKEGPYLETDTPKPLSVYGASKLAGEQRILAADCQAAIMRVQWSYGRNGNNFISKIAELAKSRSHLKVVADQIGAPTPTAEMAKAILALIRHRASGIFHYAAAGTASRFGVAEVIKDELGLQTEISPCSSDEFPAPAERPKNSVFDCSRFDQEIGLVRGHWRDLLVAYLKEWK